MSFLSFLSYPSMVINTTYMLESDHLCSNLEHFLKTQTYASSCLIDISS